MAKPRKTPKSNLMKFPHEVRLRFAPASPLVTHCERLLADAKSGRLRALVYGTVCHDGLSPAGSVDHGFCVGPGTYYAATHAVERLRRAWDRECDSGSVVHDHGPPAA